MEQVGQAFFLTGSPRTPRSVTALAPPNLSGEVPAGEGWHDAAMSTTPWCCLASCLVSSKPATPLVQPSTDYCVNQRYDVGGAR